VRRSSSLSISVAFGQLITWFSWIAWSVRAHLCSERLAVRCCSYQHSHTYVHLDMTAGHRVKIQKKWVPASSDESLWKRSKCQRFLVLFWSCYMNLFSNTEFQPNKSICWNIRTWPVFPDVQIRNSHIETWPVSHQDVSQDQTYTSYFKDWIGLSKV